MISGGITAPVGLLGVTSTRAFAPAANRGAMRAGSGTNPSAARQGRGTAGIPCISSAMRWLKYQGAGRMTPPVPPPAITAMAMEKARLQPAVMATSAAPIGAP